VVRAPLRAREGPPSLVQQTTGGTGKRPAGGRDQLAVFGVAEGAAQIGAVLVPKG
jgi:hypothetical protein